MKQKRWTKQCECGRFIPDEYEMCHYCLLDIYGLKFKGRLDSCDSEGLGSLYYAEENVIAALRKAETQLKKEVTRGIAKKALHIFRVEQQKRTTGPYYGCECDGCVESMEIAINTVLKKRRVKK